MRLLSFVWFFMVLLAVPVDAQDGGQQIQDERRMSGNLCQKKFSCNEAQGGSGASIADSCLVEVFGESAKNVSFSSASLDSDSCMRTSYSSDSKEANLSKQKYRCCIIHSKGDDICQYRCDAVIVR